MNDVCVVELGRYGDIVNILPILLHIHNQYGKPTLMVSRQFADMLDGVSYVNLRVVDLRNDQLEQALVLAKREFKHVLCAQIWGGPQYFQEKICPSYNMESWRNCGFRHKFDDPTWRPYFDRRDAERESLLVNKLTVPDKPMLLVNVTHSVSSPFHEGPKLLAAIQERLANDFNIVNVGGLKLHRIYDLLGLMDAASCLVSVDSAHLHLAPASGVPTVALVNDQPWLGSIPRLMTGSLYHYKDAVAHPEDVIASILKHHVVGGHPVSAPTVSAPPERRLFHCYEEHKETNQMQARRRESMQRSWMEIYQKDGVIACPLRENDYPRTSLDIGDSRRLPCLKDVLWSCMEKANPDDIIFFTNDDNYLHRELPEMLRFHISLYECVSAQRCEFKQSPLPPGSQSPMQFASNSNMHMGRDLFAFTKRWLDEHWDEIPDFILGCSDFDLCLATLIRNYLGIKSSRKNLEDIIFPAELPRGYVSHVFHTPAWTRPGYKNEAPGQRHNRQLFYQWAQTYAPHLRFDENLCI